MSSIEISFARESDLETVFELSKYMYKVDQVSTSIGEEWDERTKSFLRAGLEDDKVAIFVACNDNEIKINDNALVTLALLIAESKPQDKDLLVNLTKQLISNNYND